MLSLKRGHIAFNITCLPIYLLAHLCIYISFDKNIQIEYMTLIELIQNSVHLNYPIIDLNMENYRVSIIYWSLHSYPCL